MCCRQRARGDGIAGGSVLATLRCSPPRVAAVYAPIENPGIYSSDRTNLLRVIVVNSSGRFTARF